MSGILGAGGKSSLLHMPRWSYAGCALPFFRCIMELPEAIVARLQQGEIPMETDLTKRIKELTHRYSPKIKSQMRTIRWADEVWTPTGIVDSIRFEDYYASEEYTCPFLNPSKFDADRLLQAEKSGPLGQCFRDGSTTPDAKRCHGCIYRHHEYTVGMMATCYEVKITLSDFKSDNGHNFHGNENYYCVPAELAPKIKPLIPSHVGILAYSERKTTYGLRLYKSAIWQDVPPEAMCQLLYNAMKKWCDGAVFL